MAGDEEIIIDISPSGDVTVSGKNIKGADCEKLTREIEQSLGTVESHVRTAEFHETPVIKRNVNA